jgi:hypothetical protein
MELYVADSRTRTASKFEPTSAVFARVHSDARIAKGDILGSVPYESTRLNERSYVTVSNEFVHQALQHDVTVKRFIPYPKPNDLPFQIELSPPL